MKTKLLLSVFTVVMLFAQSALAREKTDVKYAYDHSIDLQGGYVMMPYILKGDAHRTVALASGCEGQIRYSYFINKHWGIFASLSSDLMTSGGTDYFRSLNYADGDIYKYSPNYNGTVLEYCLNSAVFGGVYRFDFGNWSLRPRLGIGLGSHEISANGYERFTRNDLSAYPEYITYSVKAKEEDFLSDSSNYYRYGNSWALVGYAGCQICYTFKRHFFISAEIALKAAYIPNLSLTKRVVPAETAYNPQNWAEAVYFYDYRDSYKYNYDKAVESVEKLPWSMASIQVGIGWNIGWNRNEKR